MGQVATKQGNFSITFDAFTATAQNLISFAMIVIAGVALVAIRVAVPAVVVQKQIRSLVALGLGTMASS